MTLILLHQLAPHESRQLERFVRAMEKLAASLGSTPDDVAQIAALTAELKAHDDAAAAALAAVPSTPSP